MQNAISFKSYIGKICTSIGALTGVLALLPFLSLIQSDGTAYLFPPLGDLTSFFRTIYVMMILLVVAACYIFTRSNIGRLRSSIKWCAALAAIATLAYALSVLLYVVKIPMPVGPILVSIGSVRTDFANKTFTSGEDDWTVVRQRGLADEDVMKVWTKRSVLWNRAQLFVSYLLLSINWAAALSMISILDGRSGTKEPQAAEGS
jgi:hypothetical protein